MLTSLPADSLARVRARLSAANAAVAARWPGEPSGRHPVHVVYGGAHLFKADLARKLGALALRAMEQYAPDPASLAEALGLGEGARTADIHARVLDKLRREPVEDLRVDFEDGYGVRPDAEEDGHAEAAAIEMAKGLEAGSLPPFIGIRVKSLDEEACERALRTLDIFLSTLCDRSGKKLPDGFVITLPKVSSSEQVEGLADALDDLEPRLGLAAGAIAMELMIETTQSIAGPRGELALPGLLDAARGRCVAAHLGAYDYTAACGVAAAHQTMTHPACDFARQMMQVAFARTGIRLSDGATNVLPIPPHRGAPLGEAELAENRRVVHRAWRLHHDHIQRALAQGFYQGWDLHPAQIPVRYASTYAFFFAGLDAAAERLRNFVEKAARATLVGDVFDDAATGQGLLNFFLRAIAAGALDEAEAARVSSVTEDELRTRSFAKIALARAAARGAA